MARLSWLAIWACCLIAPGFPLRVKNETESTCMERCYIDNNLIKQWQWHGEDKPMNGAPVVNATMTIVTLVNTVLKTTKVVTSWPLAMRRMRRAQKCTRSPTRDPGSRTQP
ncbi:hypothetical protein PG989_016336 [Apiospora arundinis]